MKRGRKNQTGVDWSDPDQAAAYKRQSERHHEYNRQYIKDHYTPTGAEPGAPSGEENGQAKLTWPIVRWMRQEYARGGISYTDLAVEIKTRWNISIHRTTIAGIIRGETWIELSSTTP